MNNNKLEIVYQNYYEPDKRWEIFDIKSREEYIEKYILPGNFHSLVPDDVKASYETAEYLMAHAWYHWPLYDEALKKLTGIFEIAIKQKAAQLNIPLTTTSKKGKLQSERLHEIINKICEIENDKGLEHPLLRSKDLRNTFAHPDSNSYMGGIKTTLDNIMYFINVINHIFLDYILYKNYSAQYKIFEEFKKSVDDELYVLHYNSKKYIIHDIPHFELFPYRKGYFLFLSVNRVTVNTFQIINDGTITKPLTLMIDIDGIGQNSLTGTDILSKTHILIETTDHPDNLVTYSTFISDLNRVEKEKLNILTITNNHEAGWGINRLKYIHLWDKY